MQLPSLHAHEASPVGYDLGGGGKLPSYYGSQANKSESCCSNNVCQNSHDRVAVDTQHGVAGSKLSVFSHSCPGVLTSTLPAGSAFSVPACLGPGAAVLEPSWVGPPPVSQLSHPQLPLSLVCLASLGNTPPGQGGLCLGHAYN